LPLATQPYNKLELHCNVPESAGSENNFELVVVIGGETHGVSSSAYKFAHNNHGERIFIPLKNGIESLNASSAASVILFEIQKKLLENSLKR